MTANSVLDWQGYCQQRFHYYRNGLPGQLASRQEIIDGSIAGDPWYTQRLNDITQRIASLPGQPGAVVPPAGLFNFSAYHRDRLRRIAAAGRTALRDIQLPPGNGPVAREAREAAREDLTDAYKLMRSSFRYIKCLGWGGDGVASVWRYSPGRGQEHSVVMKMSTQWYSMPTGRRNRLDTEFIDRERDVITKLGRAPHIVQRFYTAHHPRTNNPGTRRSARRAAAVADMARKIDGHEGSYFLMEYCRLGNLEVQLQKAARDMPPDSTERYLPESVLWRFFDCLVKACMAMEEPPRQNPANGAAPAAPAPTQGNYLPEVLAPGNPGREGLVHLDLDPSNVFVYGFDPPTLPVPLAPDHTTLPRLQVGDFGFTRNEESFWAHSRPPALGPGPRPTGAEWRERRHKWLLRNEGKSLYALPEQFGKDWDSIPRFQDPSDGQQQPWMLAWMPAWMQPWAPPPPVSTGPGRYSSASNAWQVGMIMKVAMTLADPDLPPYAGRMTSQEPANPAPAQECWTYGWSLLDPAEPWTNMYQQSLLDLVAGCLMAKQAHRPTLQQMQAVITAQLALPANLNVPGYWANTFFREPPPPKPPMDTENVSNIDPFWDYRGRQGL